MLVRQMLLNKNRALDFMARSGLDVLISSSPTNNTYLSGFPVQGMCGLTSAGETFMIARAVTLLLYTDPPPSIDDAEYYGSFAILPSSADSLRQRKGKSKKVTLSKIERIVNDSIFQNVLRNSGSDGVEILEQTLRKKGLGGKTIGIECGGLNFDEIRYLQRKLDRAKFADSSQVFPQIRAIKTGEEIERVMKATQIVEKGFQEAESVTRAGVKESEIAASFRKSVVAHPEVDVGWYAFLGGSRSALSLSPSSDYRLKQEDFIVFHSNLSYKYYHSDIARGGTIGKPSQKQNKVWNAIVKGEEKIIDSVAPGVKASHLFDIGMEEVIKLGCSRFERHHLGHGIGLGWGGLSYDPPVLAPRFDMELEENMILCIETPYNEIGFAGMVFEDIGIVTKKGFKLFSHHDATLKRF